jgi:hypothetical protein
MPSRNLCGMVSSEDSARYCVRFDVRRQGLAERDQTTLHVNALARKPCILYSYDQPSRELALSKGVDMGQVTGTGTWELPMPTVVLVDRDRTVRFADVSPDWLVRTEAETILASVRKIVGEAV